MNQQAKILLASGARDLAVLLTAGQLASFDLFAEELKKWNRKMNLTAIIDDEGIALKHFVDSLCLLKAVHGSGRLLDIGSGAGFPGIPLKIALPELEIVSVDSVLKKISFQKQAVRLLKLVQFSAVQARAETLPALYPCSFDRVVSRAFSDLPSFVALALPLLKGDGRIVAMKGRNAAQEVAAAESALCEMGVRVTEVFDFRLPSAGDARSLVVMAKK